MVYFDYTLAGYDSYRDGIHINCITGLLHTLLMPVAVTTFLVILQCLEYSLFGYRHYKDNKVRTLCTIISIFVTIGYLRTFPISGLITVFMYLFIIKTVMNKITETFNSEYCYYGSLRSIRLMMFNSLIVLVASILFLEYFSHGYLEGGHSTVPHFFNSIYWTPLYGTHSLYYPFTGQCVY